jgi:DNA-binding MarR family transcriptional regulator
MVGVDRTRLSLWAQRSSRRDPACGRGLADLAALSHPRHALADLLGHPVRFSVAALLAAASKVEFSFVRDHVEVTDSMLSKQVSMLEQAGYVKVDKGFVGKRGRTWLSLTREGRRAFERHLGALREIAQSDGVSGALGRR